MGEIWAQTKEKNPTFLWFCQRCFLFPGLSYSPSGSHRSSTLRRLSLGFSRPRSLVGETRSTGNRTPNSFMTTRTSFCFFRERMRAQSEACPVRVESVSSSEQSRVGTELLASYFLLKEKRRANPEPHAPRPALLEEHMGSRLGPFMAPKLKKNFEILVTALSLPSSLHFYFLSKVATVLALDNFSHSPYILQRFHSGPIIRISPHY